MQKRIVIKLISLLLLSVLGIFAILPMQFSLSNNSKWMKDLDDSTPINSLSIPGTHDSGAIYSIADLSGKCQTLNIKEQLLAGVRFLDIRLQLKDDKLRVVHSFVDQNTLFADTLLDIATFLRENPSEFLIVSIKKDADDHNSVKDFAPLLEQMLYEYGDVLNTTRELPNTVGQARGKMHILSRYSGSSLGVECVGGWYDDTSFALGDIYVQDNYNVDSANTKTSDVEATLDTAASMQYSLTLNYTSCYLASGFPPIYAGTPAYTINPYLKNKLSSGNAPTGVMVCDFITSELCEIIIRRNFK
jgi:1-phosphatidylinositol phosphodiesterase